MPFTTRQFHTLTNHVRLQQLLKRLESEFLPLLLSQSFAPVSEMQALHALLEALLFQAAQCGDVTVLRFLLLIRLLKDSENG